MTSLTNLKFKFFQVWIRRVCNIYGRKIMLKIRNVKSIENMYTFDTSLKYLAFNWPYFSRSKKRWWTVDPRYRSLNNYLRRCYICNTLCSKLHKIVPISIFRTISEFHFIRVHYLRILFANVNEQELGIVFRFIAKRSKFYRFHR